MERKTRPLDETGEAGFLESDLVIIIEIIQADDLLAAIEQAFREMIADKTGRAGDQNRHALPFVMQMIWGNAKRQ
jgi:hypothetical protein